MVAELNKAMLATWHLAASLDDDVPAATVAATRKLMEDERKPFDEAMAYFLVAAVERAGTVAAEGKASG